ncbi:MAG: hypothetical protein ACI8QC_004331 [Planctomycetota bacterium]
MTIQEDASARFQLKSMISAFLRQGATMVIHMKQHFDTGSLAVIVVTFLLFGMALFTTGFTHALLLEIGVLLVSIKLIMMAYKSSVRSESLRQELSEIRQLLETLAK